MRTNLVRMAVLAVMAATVAVPVFAGQPQSERERALRSLSDPESAMVWQIAPATETGSLPADDAKQMKSEGGARTGVSVVEVSGSVYRVGIDTP